MKETNQAHKFFTKASELRDLDTENLDYAFGLFAQNHMSYRLENKTDIHPTLTEMTEKAIEILSKNDQGYVLLVEGFIFKTHINLYFLQSFVNFFRWKN